MTGYNDGHRKSAPKAPRWVDGGDGLIRIGRITRTHGLGGEVELLFADDAFDRGEADFLVLDIEGIFVPFFWEGYRFKNGSAVILKLEGCNTEGDAKKYVGLTAYYPVDAVPQDVTPQMVSVKALVGFMLEDEEGHSIGTIDAVDDSTSNILLFVKSSDCKEFIIPFHEDFLYSFDYRKRLLRLNLPEGILDTND